MIALNQYFFFIFIQVKIKPLLKNVFPNEKKSLVVFKTSTTKIAERHLLEQ